MAKNFEGSYKDLVGRLLCHWFLTSLQSAVNHQLYFLLSPRKLGVSEPLSSRRAPVSKFKVTTVIRKNHLLPTECVSWKSKIYVAAWYWLPQDQQTNTCLFVLFVGLPKCWWGRRYHSSPVSFFQEYGRGRGVDLDARTDREVDWHRDLLDQRWPQTHRQSRGSWLMDQDCRRFEVANKPSLCYRLSRVGVDQLSQST